MSNTALNMTFDPDQVEIIDTYTVVPPGWYTVVIKESEVARNKADTGTLLTLKYEVLTGEHAGETIIDRINIIHQKDIVQRIGQSTLAKICKASGFTGKLTDSSQLHGRQLEVKVSVEEFESNKEPGKMLKSNQVNDYRKPGSGAALSVMSGGQQKKAGKAW